MRLQGNALSSKTNKFEKSLFLLCWGVLHGWKPAAVPEYHEQPVELHPLRQRLLQPCLQHHQCSRLRPLLRLNQRAVYEMDDNKKMLIQSAFLVKTYNVGRINFEEIVAINRLTLSKNVCTHQCSWLRPLLWLNQSLSSQRAVCMT